MWLFLSMSQTLSVLVLPMQSKNLGRRGKKPGVKLFETRPVSPPPPSAREPISHCLGFSIGVSPQQGDVSLLTVRMWIWHGMFLVRFGFRSRGSYVLHTTCASSLNMISAVQIHQPR